jgi:HTH-type transcriptional regulator/antitoxin HipB
VKLEQYRRQLKSDIEYQAAVRELKPIFDLADDILRLRLERGWSQSELARRAGTKQANISRLEAGLGNPTVRFIQRVARALDVELAVLLRRKPSVMHEMGELAEQYFSSHVEIESSGTSGPEDQPGELSFADSPYQVPASAEGTP